jgi:hypothetical protein
MPIYIVESIKKLYVPCTGAWRLYTKFMTIYDYLIYFLNYLFGLEGVEIIIIIENLDIT